jgi:multidrug efflux system membrane fusion protein
MLRFIKPIEACFRIFTCAGVLALAGCSESDSPAPPPPEVEVMTLKPHEIIEWDEYTGRVEAPENVEIRAKVEGYLIDVKFKDGDPVELGQTLFLIDPREFQSALKNAEAKLATVNTALKLAKGEFERASTLLASNAISRQDFDKRQREYEAAQSQLRGAESEVDNAKINLSYTDIRAPIGGHAGRAMVTRGNLVKPDTLLTTIVSVDSMFVYVDIDERAVLKYMRVYKNQAEGKLKVQMRLADEKTFPHEGFTDFADNRVNPQTGTLRARAVFPNEDGRLVPGLFARMRVPGAPPYQGISVPSRAVASEQSKKYVLVVTPESAVEYREVELGPEVDAERVVRSGLQAGDRVIVEGIQRVRPGDKVNAQEMAPSPASSSPSADAPKPSAPPAPIH